MKTKTNHFFEEFLPPFEIHQSFNPSAPVIMRRYYVACQSGFCLADNLEKSHAKFMCALLNKAASSQALPEEEVQAIIERVRGKI
jgi:hypothetical protein